MEQARAGLRRTLALPRGDEIAVVDPPPPSAPEGDRRELIDQAWDARPEVDAAHTGVRLARLNVELARRALKPTVALMERYSRHSAGELSAET